MNLKTGIFNAGILLKGNNNSLLNFCYMSGIFPGTGGTQRIGHLQAIEKDIVLNKQLQLQ